MMLAVIGLLFLVKYIISLNQIETANTDVCIRVIRAVLTTDRSLPGYPNKQTKSQPVSMSQRCQ
jgi:hypothetical protein